MNKMVTETKVGIFVTLGFIVLAVMTVTVGKFHLGKEAGYRVYVLFESAAGVVQNSPVRIAGVHVGKVERISLERGQAKVALRIPPDVQIYEDAKAYLRSEGLLGERYVEIFPGSEEKPKLREEGFIQQGAPPASIELVLSRLSGIGEDFKGVLKPLGQLLKGIDPEKVGQLVSNFETFSRDLPHLAADARETLGNFRDISAKVQRGEGTLGKLINDDEAYQDVRKTLVALRDVAEKVQRGEGTLGKLINDDEAYQDARATLANLRHLSEKLDSGEGVLGKLITDDELGQEVEKTIKKVKKAAEGVQEQSPITALGILLGLIF
jgi:phospholipid/cholesterol/gamma-HCH transport system substrate-binding protein